MPPGEPLPSPAFRDDIIRMRRLLRHLRSFLRFQPGKPAVWSGFRAAVAVTVPFFVLSLAGFPQAGWTGLTGLLVTLADRGGSYVSRAKVMGITTLTGALVGAIAAPLGDRTWPDAGLLLFGVGAATFLRCFGETAGSTGEKLAVIFVASLGAPAVGLHGASERGAALLIGGVWAMLQALVLWPVHPYLPARKAIADVYWTLADGAAELARLTREGADPQRWEAAVARHSPIRLKIEHARETLAATRVGRNDEPRRSEHLLVLLEHSEPIIALLLALAQVMESASAEAKLKRTRDRVARVCEGYAAFARRVAAVARDPAHPERHVPAASPVDPRAVAQAEAEAEPEQQMPSSVTELIARLRNYESAVDATATELQRGHPVTREVARLPVATRSWKERFIDPVLENLSADSVVLHHALRAGIVATAALLAVRAAGLGEAHWVVLSAIGILQPYSGSTEQRAIQRVTGTLVGATLAAALAGAVESQLVLFVFIGVLTATSVSLLPLNFGAFQVLLTPDFLLLATLRAGDWTIAENRALGVLIACVIALAGTWLLWPMPERRRFSDAAAAVLRADGQYLREIAAHGSGTQPQVGAVRREFGLRLLDAEASFERLMAEYRGPAHRLEPAMAVLTYSRRLAASLTALGEQLPVVENPQVLEEVAQDASGTLESLADALDQGELPPPMSAIPVRSPGEDPVSGVLAERVPRQLEILHGAVERLNAEEIITTRAPSRLAARPAPA